MSEKQPRPSRFEQPSERERMSSLLTSVEAGVAAAIESGDPDRLRRLREALATALEGGDSQEVQDAQPLPASETPVDTTPETEEATQESDKDDLFEYSTVQPDREAIELPILDIQDVWPEHTVEIGGLTSRVEKSEAEHTFERVEIRGDGRVGNLTPELLEQAGLLPHHRLETDGRTIWFSRGYDLGGGRVAVTGYVQDDDGSVVARSYYRSNSQGVWRYLPQYSADSNGNINWYSKGYGEESITLPASLQEGLTRSLEDDGGILALEKDTAQTVFAGTARHIGAEGTVYHRNVAEYPHNLSGVPERSDVGELPSPESIQPTPEQSPNFDSKLANWQQKTSLYGLVEYDVYRSNDGTLEYVFCRDAKGRAWVSGIENNSPLESTGLHEEWFSGGALATPAYEYAQQAGSYGNTADTNGHYVDMFQNYLSKVPVIQQYLASQSH